MEITKENFKSNTAILEAVNKYLISQDEDEIEEYDELFELIFEWGEDKEIVDFNYIHFSYTMNIGDYSLEVSGSSYIKNQCVYDFEWYKEVILVTDNLEEKTKKTVANEAKIIKNIENWKTFFDTYKTDFERIEKLKGISIRKLIS